MILKLKPSFKEKVWGGDKINKIFGYNTSNHIGEAWGISAHKNGSSTIIDGPYKGLRLRELYNRKKNLFGHYPKDEFPILVKIIDANDDLSIQVHPDDAYAKERENSLGKTECWYILDTEKNTNIIIGHLAKTKEEFIEHIKNHTTESILNRFPIKAEDSFNIYAGTVHAICKGTLLLEVQQSSDITYRIYDYDRLSNGKLRDLHIDKALDVIPFPDKPLSKEKPLNLFDYHILYNQNTVEHTAHKFGDYLFIIDGNGYINNKPISKGDFLMVSSLDDYQLSGEFKYAKINIK